MIHVLIHFFYSLMVTNVHVWTAFIVWCLIECYVLANFGAQSAFISGIFFALVLCVALIRA